MGVKVAIIGTGNIGTDLMIKVLRTSSQLEMGAFVGIDPDSDGLARARRLGVPVTADGVDGLVQMPGFEEIGIVFDARLEDDPGAWQFERLPAGGPHALALAARRGGGPNLSVRVSRVEPAV